MNDVISTVAVNNKFALNMCAVPQTSPVNRRYTPICFRYQSEEIVTGSDNFRGDYEDYRMYQDKEW